MKKLPLAFSGCLLGLAGAGNLISDSIPELSHTLSIMGLVLWIYFLVTHLLDWKEAQQELKKPPVLSGMATFPMAGMILATYVLRTVPSVSLLAQVLWWFSFLLDIGLITYFTIQLLTSKEKNLCNAILDRFICWNCCCCSNLSTCRYYPNSLCNDSFWISLNLLFIPTYL